MQSAGHLEHIGGTDQLSPTHSLLPADTTVHDEGPICGGQRVKQFEHRVVVPPVAREHIRRELGTVLVQDRETLSFPLGRRVEVNGSTEMRRDRLRKLDSAHCGSDTLKSIDDERRILEPHTLTVLFEILATHTQLDVGNAASLERVDQSVDASQRQHLTLVVVHLEAAVELRIDDTSEGHPMRAFRQCGVDQ